ncbi:Rad23 UV excision repair protein family [Zostera marina]|uniref:Rad23 UV excision repair protein family n=1 Tax=Zostera marina TaxID=29655 RepID=A0A0K9PBS5_ZOSMR|nr:Rad23 UV excision repair protein family [Zostera marina]
MKLTVKTLKGSQFEIKVQPHDTIMAVKKNVEEVQGKDTYPWGQQLLIHNGKVLKDETTLTENKVSEDGFLVVMLSKAKTTGVVGSSSAQVPASVPASTPIPTEAPPQAPPPVSSENDSQRQGSETSNVYGQAASNLVAGSNLEPTVQQLIDMGGGNWDKDTVIRALRAAYNNPERAVDYLYSGIPETAEVALPVARFPTNPASSPGTNIDETAAAGTTPISGIPNSSPLDLFPQGTPNIGTNLGAGTLDFLRENRQVSTAACNGPSKSSYIAADASRVEQTESSAFTINPGPSC